MANKNLITKIAGVLRVDAVRLENAINNNDPDFTVDGVIAFTSEELAAIDENSRSVGRKLGVTEGTAIGQELAVKDLKKALNLTFDGKSVEVAKAEVKKLIIHGDGYLREQIGLLNEKIEAADRTLKTSRDRIEEERFSGLIRASLPANRRKQFTDQEYVELLSKKVTVKEENGQSVVILDGRLQVDRRGRYMDLQTVLENHLSNSNLIDDSMIQVASGRGESSSNFPRKTTMSELVWEYNSQGRSMVGLEFAQQVRELSKNNPGFFDV